jgi:hypothetical protein
MGTAVVHMPWTAQTRPAGSLLLEEQPCAPARWPWKLLPLRPGRQRLTTSRGNADRFGPWPRRLPELELQRLRARTSAPVHSTGEQNNADPVAENEARQKKEAIAHGTSKRRKKWSPIFWHQFLQKSGSSFDKPHPGESWQPFIPSAGKYH